MRWWRNHLRENPPKTTAEIAQEPPENLCACGDTDDAHCYDGERLHCPLRIVN